MGRKKQDVAEVSFHDELSSLRSIHDNWEFKNAISTPCTFAPQTFLDVMLNLVKNPNITATHLFRADILYDSINDQSYVGNDLTSSYDPLNPCSLSSFISHMKQDLRPRTIDFESFALDRSVVREMVPRNPRIDKRLVQSCHFYEARKRRSAFRNTDSAHSRDDDIVDKLVLYLPHVDKPQDMPWYHPSVKALAFRYTGRPRSKSEQSQVSGACLTNQDQDSEQDWFRGEMSIHIAPFKSRIHPENPSGLEENPEDSESDPNRLHRTLLRLLTTVKKHGTGREKGYEKRGRHDSVIPQKRFQDTYTRLKMTYAQSLMNDWQEQTDPRKHVFEDLGIAAYLIELWRDMYRVNGGDTSGTADSKSLNLDSTVDSGHVKEGMKSNGAFPGFVDVACGNGVLVHILVSEGYAGWGFDARQRKSWTAFPTSTREHLKEMLFVPDMFACSPRGSNKIHNGVFPSGTFIISNHADELTVWTPLMGLLSGGSPFVCIPCCSHDLAGQRTRFPKPPKEETGLQAASHGTASQVEENSTHSLLVETHRSLDDEYDRPTLSTCPTEPTEQSVPRPSLAAETGSLSSLHHSLPATSTPKVSPRSTVHGHSVSSGFKDKMDAHNSLSTAKPSTMSAYATLCAYVTRLSQKLGYEPLDDMLRIPSTRNVCIVCKGLSTISSEDITGKVIALVTRELPNGLTLGEASSLWMERAEKIQKLISDSGH
ncbi:MAG: tRNA(Ser) Um(44) 2'-O-methyltransferase [Alyxoria varia]|nr:MAG: tRNA(Ser) Um(44) 2'-O-methyltransferase [Alyxoria varia]